MESIVKVLMRRDGMSRSDAEELYQEALEELKELGESGGSLCEAEDLVKDYFGLEPDYLTEMINDLTDIVDYMGA